MDQNVKSRSDRPELKRTRAEVLRERSKHMLRVAELDAELADMESVTTAADRYSSTCLPPDCQSRRTFAVVCRSGRIAGAVLEGHVWSCAKEAWHTARARKRPLRLVPQPMQGDEAIAARALAAAGLRATRRAS